MQLLLHHQRILYNDQKQLAKTFNLCHYGTLPNLLPRTGGLGTYGEPLQVWSRHREGNRELSEHRTQR